MRHADEPELTEQDKRGIEAIRLELDREFGPPWPDAAPPAGGPLARPARSSIARASSARPSKGLRLALGAGIATLAAAVVAAVVSLVDVGALISPPQSASLRPASLPGSVPAPHAVLPALSEPDATAAAQPPLAAQPAVDRDAGESRPFASRARPASRASDPGEARRSSGAPEYRRPVGAQPGREGGVLTTRYRTERVQSSARGAERVGFVQAP
jgi:hypothetical protein